MTAADIRRYVGALTDDLVFGALQRFHDEVLPRDRPKDGVIKAADDYRHVDRRRRHRRREGLLRAGLRQRGRHRDGRRPHRRPKRPATAIDVAFASYTHVVNPPPAPEPGQLRGPIGTDRRFLTVPD